MPNLVPSKFWSLGHVILFTNAQTSSPKVWSSGMLSILALLKFGAWSMLYILYMPNLKHPNFGVLTCGVFYTCPTMILQFLELEVCCTCYTCPTLMLQNIELGHVVYFTHDQPWSPKSWRLGHVVYFTHAQPCSSKFWSLRHVVHFEHAQLWFSKLWSLGNTIYILHMPYTDPPNFGG